MPNVGRPSRACRECRVRRTRCDLARPECSPCLRKGISCSGYRSELDMRFRVETVSTFQVNNNRDKRKSSDSNSDPLLLSLGPRGRVVTKQFIDGSLDIEYFHQTIQGWQLHFPLSESWETHFMPYWIKWIRAACTVGPNAFKVIEGFLTEAEPSSALFQACNAAACASTARNRSLPNVSCDQERAYISSIAAVRSALLHPVHHKSDNTLLAIWMLGIYELLHSVKNNCLVVGSAWRIHRRFFREILRLRGPDQFESTTGRLLFFIFFPDLEIEAFLSGVEWTEAIPWFHSFYQHCDPSEYAHVRLFIYSHHCSCICARIQRLLDAGDLNDLQANVPDILRQTEDVENVTYPLSDKKHITDIKVDPPLAPFRYTPDTQPKTKYYASVQIHQTNCRIRLTYHVLKLLRQAFQAPNCTSLQRQTYVELQGRCIQEVQALANRLLLIHTSASPGSESRTGAPLTKLYHEEPRQISNNEESIERAISKGIPRTAKMRVFSQQDSSSKSTLLIKHDQTGFIVTEFCISSD